MIKISHLSTLISKKEKSYVSSDHPVLEKAHFSDVSTSWRIRPEES